MTSVPPSGPNLDFYRKQAKQLVRAVRAGDGRAFERIRPQLRHIVSLADAQLVVAREQGFESWAAFQQSVGGSAREHVVPGAALAELAELLHGDAFAVPGGACERLRRALGSGDASAAAHCACEIRAKLDKLRKGHSVDAERAGRAYQVLERAIRDEGLDLSAIRCSFCLKETREVVKLIRGQQGYICDVCTATAVEILGREVD